MKGDTEMTESSERVRSGSWAILLASFLSIFFVMCLFMAMRGVLELGGFVAKGGPYVIEHEAPGYIWIFPVAIFCLLASIFYLIATMGRRGGVDLLAPLILPLLFLSLGWNFFEYALFRFHHVEWGWLICGVLFFAIGLVPLVLVIKKYPPTTILRECMESPGPVLLQVSGAALGIVGGYFFFRLIS